ncbi:uncharacterized protein LOC121180730 [Toxotes jaculatrix]|uniref:uncharacterized protein LOC121180730 n=1 Tax=Toxotes jaculatrix TaxID=941984 RepID=UPI001B3A8FFC|nr:uncharacterized protein LOC121180730 [Toxotes jaculatrix]
MFSTKLEYAFVCFILYIPGLWGQANSVCALRGSSVDLHCSAEHPTTSMKWYTVHWEDYEVVQNELSLENCVTYKMYVYSNFTLTINDLRESDENVYCCKENTDTPEHCWSKGTKLQVADLQVKVIPTTEGQKVTLMCSTSCPLTENPEAYIWYKNGELLYEDWSPWYQELVSSEEAVRYSCAIKGYEDLRAPEVSVDSITSTCFSVTYAKGKMCSYQQKSEDRPCSNTYPREIHVQKTPATGYVILNCTTSCPLPDPQTAYTWYQDGILNMYSEIQQFAVSLSTKRLSCAINGHEDLLSAEVCADDKNCWSVNYVSRRICALQGSSVNISSKYSYPDHRQPTFKCWYKLQQSGKEDAKNVIKPAGRVEHHDDMKNLHILRITELRKTDSAKYTFKLLPKDGGQKQSDLHGVTLVITGLKVTFTPSAVVAEGQRVTLTCSTSCPLPDDTTYIWYMNSQPLTLQENQSKHLVLDPVSSQHAGNYTCSIETHIQISSYERTLTVQALWNSMAIINAVRLTVVLLVPIPLLLFHLWMRKKKTQPCDAEPNYKRSARKQRTHQS